MRRTVERALAAVAVVCFLLGAFGVPRAPSIDRDGYWRDPSLWARLFPQVEGMYRASIIKSIQRGTITIAGGATSGTATLSTAVTTTNAAVAHLGNTTASSAFPSSFCRLVLTNSTTVTATRSGSTGALPVSYEVREFYGSVLTATAAQAVSITIASALSNTQTITSVTTSKAQLVNGGYSTDDNTDVGFHVCRLELTDATTVTASTGSTGTRICTGTVMEFK